MKKEKKKRAVNEVSKERFGAFISCYFGEKEGKKRKEERSVYVQNFN